MAKPLSLCWKGGVMYYTYIEFGQVSFMVRAQPSMYFSHRLRPGLPC